MNNLIDSKLEKLRDNVSYYEWKFESCHRFWKNEYLTEIRKARAKLKEYKAKHYPEMLQQNLLLTQPKPFKSTNDFSENFEEYAN
jgi:Fe-S oxidoreductase